MALIKAKVRMGIGSDAEQSLSSYPLVGRVVPPEGITFSWIQDEMEALNRRALRKEFEVSAMSVMTFLQVANHYAVMPCALTSGDNCGPLVVSLEPMYPKQLVGKRIAHPGPLSTAFFLLRLFVSEFEEVSMNAGAIAAAVAEGKVDAGIFVGRQQIDFQNAGFCKVADLGEWFYEMTRLPLPQDLFGIRKTLGRDVMRKTTRLLRDSAAYALKHCPEILSKTIPAGDEADRGRAREWVRRYIEGEALELSRKAREGIAALADIAAENGLAGIDPRKIEYVAM